MHLGICADWTESLLLADAINIKILGIVPSLSYVQQIQVISVPIHLSKKHAYLIYCQLEWPADNLYKEQSFIYHTMYDVASESEIRPYI